MEGARLDRWEVAKVVRDKHYDAVTVRIFGAGRDATLDVKTGRLVGGDASANRPYSEYWTLVRGAGTRGAPSADKACPACGAPLKVNMGGNCEYCGALVASATFDFVLGKIEQDEAYAG